MPNQSIDLHELFQQVMLEAHAAWRYRWHALVVAWCLVIAGALLVFSLPNKYESSAQVYADTDALTNPLLSGITVHSNVQQRLDVITQTLLSRPNLANVADSTGLSVRATSPSDKDALLDQLAKAVKVKSAGPRNLYNISYSDRNPRMAQKVVQAFVEILMNDTLGETGAAAASAQKFLQQQVDDYNDRLNAAEKKIADFKKENSAYLPNAGAGGYAASLANAQARLQTLESAQAAVQAGRPTALPRMVNPEVQQIDQQIAQYQNKLNALLLSYTDAYPDVISTKRAIKDLEARRADALKHPGRRSSVAMSDGSGRSGGGELAAQITAQKQQIADLEGNADKISKTQVELAELTRDYNTTQKQYDLLLTRLNTAQLSQDATQSGNNLKFRVISPPILPLLPVSPKRGLMLLAVFVLALGIGGAFGFFLHKIKPVFLSLKSLKDFGDFPVIGTFSLITTAARREERRREVAGFCAGVALLGVVVVLGFAFNAHLATMMQHVFTMGAT